MIVLRLHSACAGRRSCPGCCFSLLSLSLSFSFILELYALRSTSSFCAEGRAFVARFRVFSPSLSFTPNLASAEKPLRPIGDRSLASPPMPPRLTYPVLTPPIGPFSFRPLLSLAYTTNTTALRWFGVSLQKLLILLSLPLTLSQNANFIPYVPIRAGAFQRRMRSGFTVPPFYLLWLCI